MEASFNPRIWMAILLGDSSIDNILLGDQLTLLVDITSLGSINSKITDLKGY
jgi:hypothetical protein